MLESIRAWIGRSRKTQHGPFEPGQVWRFRSRTGSDGAHLVVLKTEALPGLGDVVHIAVEGVMLPGPGGAVVTRIAHVPFSEQAIDESVTEMLRSGAPLPDFQTEYDVWRNGDMDDGYGVFTVPVHVVIEGTTKARR